MSTELDEATIVERYQRSRASQRLPERIVDAAVLAKVVTPPLVPTPEGNGTGDNGSAPSRAEAP